MREAELKLKEAEEAEKEQKRLEYEPILRKRRKAAAMRCKAREELWDKESKKEQEIALVTVQKKKVRLQPLAKEGVKAARQRLLDAQEKRWIKEWEAEEKEKEDAARKKEEAKAKAKKMAEHRKRLKKYREETKRRLEREKQLTMENELKDAMIRETQLRQYEQRKAMLESTTAGYVILDAMSAEEQGLKYVAARSPYFQLHTACADVQGSHGGSGSCSAGQSA